jgi:hypothetical protein
MRSRCRDQRLVSPHDLDQLLRATIALFIAQAVRSIRVQSEYE